MPSELKLPELGEDVTTGDVLRVLVKAGDVLAKDQPVLELETDKATIEVPSSVAGTVKDVKVKAGDKIEVGETILTYEAADGSGEQAGEEAEGTSAGPAAGPVERGAEGKRTEGKRSEKQEKSEAKKETKGEAREEAEEEAEEETREGAEKESDAEPERASPSRDRKVVDIGRAARQASPPAASDRPAVPAAPSVRRMARELGVDIDQVTGTGSEGRISIEDVKAHARRIVTGGQKGRPATEPLPDFSRWGEIDRQPMRAVRRKTAEHLAAAWAAVPHVTQHELVDITALEDLRRRYAKKAEAHGGSLTVTAIAVKVVAAALKVFPQLNSSIDLAADEIIIKKYVHIGIAVDTDRGLLVPVVRDADTKNILQLSAEIAKLSEKARSRRVSLEEMQGGTFSVSNLGGIGGSFFTPIVNLPEVAILGISRARMEPVYSPDSGQFVPRLMLPLSLSYDHRVVDGADGIRFLRWVSEALEQPFLLALEG